MTQTQASRDHDFFSAEQEPRLSFFRLDSAQDIDIVGAAGMSAIPESITEQVDVDDFFDGRMKVQPCVARPNEDGMSLGAYWFEPNFTMPRHHHDTDQIVMVVEGELHQGKRVLTPGCGYFTKAGTTYAFKAGPEGCRILEFRNVTGFATTFVENDPARWVHGEAVTDTGDEGPSGDAAIETSP